MENKELPNPINFKKQIINTGLTLILFGASACNSEPSIDSLLENAEINSSVPIEQCDYLVAPRTNIRSEPFIGNKSTTGFDNQVGEVAEGGLVISNPLIANGGLTNARGPKAEWLGYYDGKDINWIANTAQTNVTRISENCKQGTVKVMGKDKNGQPYTFIDGRMVRLGQPTWLPKK